MSRRIIVVYAVMCLNRGDTSSSESSRTFPADARREALA